MAGEAEGDVSLRSPVGCECDFGAAAERDGVRCDDISAVGETHVLRVAAATNCPCRCGNVSRMPL